MEPMQKWKLNRYKKKFGEMTIDEAIQLAIESEEHKIACGPSDSAFGWMATQQHALEEYALLLEKEHHEHRLLES